MSEIIFASVFLGVLILALLTGIMGHNKTNIKLCCSSMVITSIYLIIRIIYLTNGYDFRVLYTDIDNEDEYYGLISNSIFVEDTQMFYSSLCVIWLTTLISEIWVNSGVLFVMWLSLNTVQPFISWTIFRTLKNHINVYLYSYEIGMASTITCFGLFVVLNTLIEIDIKKESKQILMVCVCPIMIIIFNIIFMDQFNEDFPVISSNLGLLFGCFYTGLLTY